MSDDSSKDSKVIGIDGGGSSTTGVISDFRGNILAKSRGGPSNFQSKGLKSAVREVSSVVNNLLEKSETDPKSIAMTVAGIAGVGRPSDAKIFRDRLRRALPEELRDSLKVTTDLHVALFGAFKSEAGVIVNAGTGAIAMGKDQKGNIKRADGWGYLLGDVGSGFWIGLEGIKRSLQYHDHRGPPTSLKGILKQNFDLRNFEDIVPKVYERIKKSSPSSIASVSKLIFKAAENGDKIACSIISEAGRELGKTASTVMKNLSFSDKEKALQLVLMGGVFSSSNKYLFDSFEEELSKGNFDWAYKEPAYPPEVGALLLGCDELGCKDFVPRLTEGGF